MQCKVRGEKERERGEAVEERRGERERGKERECPGEKEKYVLESTRTLKPITMTCRYLVEGNFPYFQAPIFPMTFILVWPGV